MLAREQRWPPCWPPLPRPCRSHRLAPGRGPGVEHVPELERIYPVASASSRERFRELDGEIDKFFTGFPVRVGPIRSVERANPAG